MIPIDAPLYPPAAAFEQPSVAPRPLSVRNYAISELVQMPAAWAVVVKHLPAVRMMVSSDQAKAMLSSMTLVDFAQFGAFPADALDKIDAELAQLPGAGASR